MAELDMDKIVKDAIDSLVIDGKSLSEWVQLIKEYEEHKQKSYTGCESKLVIDGNGNMTIVVKQGWISVKDRLPEKPGKYLVYAQHWIAGVRPIIKCELWIHDKWDKTDAFEVTHWMPLPEPPKEEQK